MSETNGKWKFEPKVALTIGAALVYAGTQIGMLLSLQRDVAEIKAHIQASVVTRTELAALVKAGDDAHVRLWEGVNLVHNRIDAIERRIDLTDAKIHENRRLYSTLKPSKLPYHEEK